MGTMDWRGVGLAGASIDRTSWVLFSSSTHPAQAAGWIQSESGNKRKGCL